MAYQETYKRAFNLILNRLISLPTVRNTDWISSFNYELKVGDFISLDAAPPSDWQLSWVEKLEPSSDRILLKSALTGQLCWWSNVGYTILKKERILDKFKWTDRQFLFDDKFSRAIRRNNDPVLTYGGCVFEGFKVTCYLRKRLGFSDDWRASITFEDFRKVKASQLNEFYITHSKEQN